MDAEALGSLLREAREAREVSLAEAEQALRIRQRLLAAFEDGNFELPEASPVQLRGFLGNYARYLGLDDADVLQQFELVRREMLRRQKRERRRRRPGKESAAPAPAPAPSLALGSGERLQQRRRRRRGFLNALLVLAMGAVALGVIVFVALQFLEDEEVLPLPAGELPRLLPPTALPTVALQLPATEVPGRSPAMRQRQITQNWNGSGVLVTIEAAQRTWLLVMGDDEEVFVGMLRPGEYVEAAARFEVLLRAGNAEALLITWNGQEQGIPGLRGQLVEMTFTQTSVAIETGAGFEPTPEFTATAPATSTLEVSALLGTTTPESTPDRLPGPVLRSPPTITRTPAPGVTVTATMTPTDPATATPTVTLTATAARTATAIVSPSATAVLPPRVTLPPLTPAKARREG